MHLAITVTSHTPELAAEKERIEKAGGRVRVGVESCNQNVPVVSRGAAWAGRRTCKERGVPELFRIKLKDKKCLILESGSVRATARHRDEAHHRLQGRGGLAVEASNGSSGRVLAALHG